MATKPRNVPAGGAKKGGSPARSSAKGAAKPKARAKTSARKAEKKAKTAVAPAKAAGPKRHQPESLRLRALSVSLTVNDLAHSLRFYLEALGFTLKQRFEEAGQLMGVMLIAGECELGLAQDDWAKGRDRVKGVGFRIYAQTVQDLDELAERIRAHGFAAEGPKTEPWGARTVTVTDPDGFKLTFHDGMS